MIEQKILPNGWKHFVSPSVEVFPPEATKQALAFLERWAPVYPKGDTWVGRDSGTASLFVRFDCMVDADGKLGICEVEERPCGMGATAELNPVFAEQLAYMRKKWPDFKWVRDPQRVTDDEMWLGPGLTLTEALELTSKDSTQRFLVRCRPENDAFRPLEPYAVSSVSMEGNKTYGETLGLWQRHSLVRAEGLTEQPYLEPGLSGSCVAKAPVGTRTNGVRAYIDPRDRDKVVSSRHERSVGDIVRMARYCAHIYVQRLIYPMYFDHLASAPGFKRHNGIYRMYFGYDPHGSEWVPMGGMWTACNKSVIVHGGDHIIMGPLLPS